MKGVNTKLLDAIKERERRALSATWASRQLSPSAIRDRRVAASDEQLVPWVRKILPQLGVSHASRSFGGFRRNDADRRPPKSIVTNLIYPLPEPGRPFPGADTDTILVWNLHVIESNPSPLIGLYA